MKSYFPDVNVWIALAYRGHRNHDTAARWFEGLSADKVYFCRLTQIGFLRLMTQPQVMRGDVISQEDAWNAYDALLRDPRIFFQIEPEQSLEKEFRRFASSNRPSARQWSDAYLAAFARTADLTLVTFDRALQRLAAHGTLLLA